MDALALPVEADKVSAVGGLILRMTSIPARNIVRILPLFVFYGHQLAGAAEDRFLIEARLQPGLSGETRMVVQASLAPGQILYADRFQVEVPAPAKIIPLSLPVPQQEKDVFSGENKLIYGQSFAAVYLVQQMAGDSLDVKITYQGCDKETCFLPASK